jgi:hypothetical protein
MKKHLFVLLTCLFSSSIAYLHKTRILPHRALSSTRKRVNMYGVIKKVINKDNESWYAPAFESYKKNNPQFKVLKSTEPLATTKRCTRRCLMMRRHQTAGLAICRWHSRINTIYTDLNTNLSINQ